MDAKNRDIELRKELEKAIETGDMEKINNIMNNIPDCQPKTNVNDFIKEVRHNCAGEVKTMKKKISVKIAIAAAAVLAVSGVSVGAATLLKQFTFFKNDQYVTVSSNSDLSEKEADKLAEDTVNNLDVSPNEHNTVKPEVFENIQAAEKAYDMNIIMPEKMPALNLSDITGSQMYTGENSNMSNVWINYGDPEKDKKAFGLTVTRNNFADGDKITSISSSDAIKDGEGFTSDKGYSFNILKESDEERGITAKIMTTTVGEYEYSMVFFGFNDNEINDIVNSVDLSQYE